MVCDESIRVSRISRVRVRFSNVPRVRLSVSVSVSISGGCDKPGLPPQ